MVVDQEFEKGAWLSGKKKGKHGRPSTSKGGPQYQDHVKMNTHIL